MQNMLRSSFFIILVMTFEVLAQDNSGSRTTQVQAFVPTEPNSLTFVNTSRSKIIGKLDTEAAEKQPAQGTQRTDIHALTLSELKLASLTKDQCKALRINACFIKYWLCESGVFWVDCSGTSSADVRAILEKVKDLIPASPLQIEIHNPVKLALETFAPMIGTGNIIRLDLWAYPDLNTDQLIPIQLPNLLEIRFIFCTAVNITKAGLFTFSDLRSVVFRYSTIRSIERGAFDSLIGLKLLALDYAIAPPFDAEQRAHLTKFHCEANYFWLREFLRLHPQLLQSKKDGEIYKISGQVSSSWTLRDIFYPVDCSRGDLTQKVDFDSLSEFSIHTAL